MGTPMRCYCFQAYVTNRFKSFMLTISVLTIGDELCIGQVVNTNAAWIASRCTQIGCSVHSHSTIGDSRSIMFSELQRLCELSDIVIITGGLGPTHDDITKFVVAEFAGMNIIEDEATIAHLQEMFTKRGREFTDRNRGQALKPDGARILTNTRGTAPGLALELQIKSKSDSDLQNTRDVRVYCLPGVPTEMKGLMEDYVFREIEELMRSRGDSITRYKTLMTAGVPESTLADMIGDHTEFMPLASLAFLPNFFGVRLRIGVQADSLDSAKTILEEYKNEMYKKIGKYIYAEDNETLSYAVHKELIAQHKTIAIAESCTGGMLGTQLTENGGSSEYFLGGIESYSNESKIRDVGIDASIIEQYGAVSEQTVSALASGVRAKFGTDYGIAISGIAGPGGGSPEKPIGTVWIGIADSTGVRAFKNNFGNDRTMIRERATSSALWLLLRYLRRQD
jgi:nicotinamide-nucleotide amidase